MPQHNVQLLRKPVFERALLSQKYRYRQNCCPENALLNGRLIKVFILVQKFDLKEKVKNFNFLIKVEL